ncbi:type I DNA topoisomerase [Mycoplasmopsis cricetuli]|uniref:type I DNA topoisomerase n=1 Tax=Mycoplasmopsis cricetuli TaxID=171283 RepID=UPI00046E5841|nr:type I DNA topoisomerase [Mycoplasmopsis cricetuli]
MNKLNLVIVESPNKVKTIKKYLGDEYEVIASVGHIMKLKKEGLFSLGIDLEKWEPKYVLDTTKKEIAKTLKNAVKNSNTVYIATDPDREGEAIGDHLVNYLKVKDNYFRIKYNEITKPAILHAIDNPTKLDQSLIEAQKARRMLDRIIGFRLSGLLKNKIYNSPTTPSAGRVQSIALKLIIDREQEIEKFVPEKYSKLTAIFQNQSYQANYINLNNSSDKREWIFEHELKTMQNYFNSAKKELIVSEITKTERKAPQVQPFKQAALYKRSPYNSQITQIIAQKLYEGYGEGGLITYPRTDSTRLSETFVKTGQNYISEKYGQEYILDTIKGFKGDQDAHEAIRPTDVYLTPQRVRDVYPQMSDQEFNLYKLIYQITLQSLIKQPIRINTSYLYQNGKYLFKNSFFKTKFKGYYVVIGEPEEIKDPEYKQGQIIEVEKFNFQNHQTKPAPRYNDGSLIEALDNIKVGRPSTFATTVKIIKDREYVESFENTLKPTEFGKLTLDKLIKSFPKIINESYTAEVEEQLDKIAENLIDKNFVMQNFWDKFTKEFEQARNSMEVSKIQVVELDENCPDDEGVLVERRNKKGQKFIGCKNFPNCTYTRSIPGQNNFKFKKKKTQQNKKAA